MSRREKIDRWWRRTIAADKVGVVGAVARGGLFAGTLPFEAVARLRNLFYDRGLLPVLTPPVPVVSFGNLTVGGTGKTPAVIWCARYLREKGLKPGIASRGYNPGAEDAALANDEAGVISEAAPDIPQVRNADRAVAAASLVRDHGANVVLLDDGFQHRRLHRTLDFLLVDALSPFGLGYMLPRGLLREPLSSLRRATCIIVTRSNLVSSDALVGIRRRIWDIDEGIKFAEAVHRPTLLATSAGEEAPETLQGRRVFAFCGIANPYSFLATLTNLGADVVGIRSFDDHHAYTDDDLKTVFSQGSARGADMVVTTQKDRVKCGWQEGRDIPLGELRVEFEIVRGRQTVESALDFLASGIQG
ncbi:MAG: tetraacyldisaccharide 4'-kinase [Planctomycetes bacterium]|nr:tetraacyldisaccharide 4'-kinase [Planctomycetota bacterium]